jgi:hypothetical protein
MVISGTTAIAEQAEISGTANVYLRSGPSADTPTVGVLSAGDKVTIVDTQGVWARVVTADTRVGYLNRRFLTPTGESPQAFMARPEEGASELVPPPSPAGEERTPELSAEMAALRAEISELKQKIDERRGEDGSPTRPSVDISTTPVARTPLVAIDTRNAPATAAGEQGVGVLAVAMLCLIIGWVLGSTFTRRRSRSQRSRLRF